MLSYPQLLLKLYVNLQNLQKVKFALFGVQFCVLKCLESYNHH